MKVPCSAIDGLLDFTVSIWQKCDRTYMDIATLISIANHKVSVGNHFTWLNREFWLKFSSSGGSFNSYNFPTNSFKSTWSHFLITRFSKLGIQLKINL